MTVGSATRVFREDFNLSRFRGVRAARRNPDPAFCAGEGSKNSQSSAKTLTLVILFSLYLVMMSFFSGRAGIFSNKETCSTSWKAVTSLQPVTRNHQCL